LNLSSTILNSWKFKFYFQLKEKEALFKKNLDKKTLNMITISETNNKDTILVEYSWLNKSGHFLDSTLGECSSMS
jgi:hypothetical protein